MHLLPHHEAEGFFQRQVTVLNVFTQGIVDQGLIVAPAGSIDLAAKPGQDIVVDADGNTGLSGRRRVKCSTFSPAESVCSFTGWAVLYREVRRAHSQVARVTHGVTLRCYGHSCHGFTAVHFIFHDGANE